jgi:hypothetical protein
VIQGILRTRRSRPVGVREEKAEVAASGRAGVRLTDGVQQSPSWLTSTIAHFILLLVLAMLTLPQVLDDDITTLTATPSADEVDFITPEKAKKPSTQPTPLPFTSELPRPDSGAMVGELLRDISTDDHVGKLDEYLGLENLEPGKFLETAMFGTLLNPAGGLGGKGGKELGGRRIGGYEDDIDTPPGDAVTAALAWLVQHQLPDGGWSFDHALAPGCRGKCRGEGQLADARIAATALALMPFLGAGKTHRNGNHQATVGRGLRFLVAHMKLDANGGSLHEPGGQMYSHGLASIVLCEALAMSKDRTLIRPAQASLNFICTAQDPVGGGWRYERQQPGDMSVFGWQLMALKSGLMAYLQVPSNVIRGTETFLDHAQYDSGARYGYTDGGGGSSATAAIGLLCRMYLGWKRDHAALQRGVDWLAEQGPSQRDMYYNYYATQVMYHCEGRRWTEWDAVMQPYLVDSQATDGHEKGSWYFKGGDHGERKGGRLYFTAMAAMTLEVDYRCLPLYDRQSIEQGFPD